MPALTTVKIPTAALLLCVGFAAACSGDAPPPPPPGVEITADNAVEVATIALQAAFGLAETGEVVGALFDVPLAPPPAPATALAATTTTTLPGPEGGQVLVTWTDQDGNGLTSPADSFVYTFADYGRLGLRLDGVVLADVLDTTGQVATGQAWTVDALLTFANLQVTEGADSVLLGGAQRYRRERRATVMLSELAIDTPFAFGSGVLQPGNRIGYNTYPFEFQFALSGNGAVEATGFEGQIRFSTEVFFTGFTFFPNPWTGRLEIRGAGASVITARMVESTSTVEILVDLDGNGSTDQTATIDWSQL
ncbi:MAG: hypothetical protein KF830_07075 [Planctomycetes bacterium]|nr:hypothetical protein [Planctomycetota bacterium]